MNEHKIIINKHTSPCTLSEASVDDRPIDLIEALQDIDEIKIISKNNEISVSDNNGGRIKF